MTRRLATLAAAAALAAGLGACDENGEEQDYVDSVNEITETLRDDVTELSNGSRATGDPEATARIYDEFAAEFGDAAMDAEALDPPEQIAEQHDRIVQDLNDMEREAAMAADVVRDAAATDIVHVSARLEIDVGRLASDIDATIEEINAELQE